MPQGRIVVAGRGYIRILVEDGIGRAGRAIEFAAEPKDGAMGLLWEGNTLFAMGDGGLRRYVDADGDGKADGPSELLKAMKTGGEHAAHATAPRSGWLALRAVRQQHRHRQELRHTAHLACQKSRSRVACCV